MKTLLTQKKAATTLLFILCLALAQAGGAQELSDAAITIAVEKQIERDPGTSLNDLDITTSQGIVTLSGTVATILARERAVKVAQTVKGVRSVVDTIAVVPSLRPDEEIAEDIREALVHDPLSESWEIDVAVREGHAVLTGETDSWAERQIIGRIAKSVRGVASLTNNLAISYETERQAGEMEAEIEERLRWDALVDDSFIEVDVIGSTAVLSGTVGSAAEYRQARHDSWVAGITAVDSEELAVNWRIADNALRKKKYRVEDDSTVEQAIKDALLYDPRVNMFAIRVEADDGWATLHGTVDNLRAKRAAATDARNTVGVWQVKNYIKVRPDRVSDRQTADRVRNALLRDPSVQRFGIDVSAVDGEVYLSGEVDSFFEKAQADHISAGVRGVEKVHNRLQVRTNEVITHSPYLDPWYTYDYDWYVYPDYIPTQPDSRIEREINDELFWSPFVDSENIAVTVDGGIATLSGTVDSWFEYGAATENALEGGAVGVDNELAVDNS